MLVCVGWTCTAGREGRGEARRRHVTALEQRVMGMGVLGGVEDGGGKMMGGFSCVKRLVIGD